MKAKVWMVFLALAAADAHAAAPSIGNDKEPIDITADKLEVFQEENRAVFTGHVIAIQGDTRLASDKMIVHYHQKDETQGAPEENQSIRRIEVEQNVFLTTPTETASGITGVYDLEKREILLNGNVVLTQKNNTIKGDHLTYDLNTGKSVLTSGDVQAVPSGPKPKPARVRALFVPEGAKTEQKK